MLFGAKVCLGCLVALVFVCRIVAAQPAFCQEPAPDQAASGEAAAQTAIAPSAETAVAFPPAVRAKEPVQRDITVEGLVSYGNYRLWASSEDIKLYDAGVEYDRNSWGYALGARVDYVAEILPMVLLNQPKQTDIWGGPETQARKTVPGVDIMPIGFRMLWRNSRAIKPYIVAKGGFVAFTQKAISSKATYENFSLQDAFGLQVRMNERIDLRLGLWGDFHFSNGFIVPVNPGIDVMNATMGLVYHLGNKGTPAAH
jgi:hypothetical protein